MKAKQRCPISTGEGSASSRARAIFQSVGGRRVRISQESEILGAMTKLFEYRELLRNLVLKDLKLKYRDSILGFFWSLANPLLLILIYSFVFTNVLRMEIPNFPYFLLVGILPWNFFSQSVLMSTGSVLDNGSLIKKIPLPMEIFPIATILFNLAQYMLVLMVFLPAAAILFRFPLSFSLTAFLPVLALHALFTLGLGFIVSCATVFYRDVRHFTEISLALLFWLTPIVYDINGVPGPLRRAVYSNPLSFFILAYQDIMYRQKSPSLDQALILVFLSASMLAVGYALFCRYKARFAEEV